MMNGNDFYSLLYEKYGVMPPGKYDQDWCFTAGDSAHTEDYIDFYNEYSLTPLQKTELLNMIIQGFDDLITDEVDCNSLNRIWNKIKMILTAEKQIHDQTILYWCCMDTELEEDRFYVSKFMRELL